MSGVARRRVLQKLEPRPDTHAGLWMDRYLKISSDSRTGQEEAAAAAKARHLLELAQVRVPLGYPEAFQRRRDGLLAQGARVATAECVGRLVVGLGAKGPLEVGLHLDHTWGVPVLPGSALKGLCVRAADLLVVDPAWRRQAESHRELFGARDHQGAVVFHDAWWDPQGQDHLPLHLDVMTVHHPDYYQGGGQSPPADTDSPTPVPFISVTGRFLVAVSGTEQACEAALSILKLGLLELGLGAKTNAGYGRLHLEYETAAERQRRAAEQQQAEAARAEAARQALQKKIAEVLEQLKHSNAGQQVPALLAQLEGEARREFARGVVDKLSRKWLRERAGKYSWAAEVLQVADGDRSGS
ncbi:MAG: type III-B CRISPR module RAMP protein Cmr6 [Myxococcota bacterium]|nr:type III-B CRISPR module RAMP protein Cmr6 [Myxococcota bacterium]